MLKIDKKKEDCVKFAQRMLNDFSFLDCSNLDRMLGFKDKLLENIKEYWCISNQQKNRKNVVFHDDQSLNVKTSGSTADPFEYKLFLPTYQKIEIDYHYKHVLKEFGMDSKPISILKVSPLKTTNNCQEIKWNGCCFWMKVFHPDENDFMYSHGSKNATCYFFQYKIDYIKHFCNFIEQFVSNHKIDILFSSFSFVSIYISFCCNNKICSLLSNTCEELDYDAVDVLKKNNLIDNYCDHMKCWDGGFGFFTCRHNTKHIYELFCESETKDHKIITTDYFNFCTSFVNYINDDTGIISDDWQLCECGRYYRRLIFNGIKKSFTIGNKLASIDLYDIVSKYKKNIQAICYKNVIEITTPEPIDLDIQEDISKKIPFPVFFTLKNFTHSGRYNKMLRLVDKTNEQKSFKSN